ncbi:M23 family metallopeptidase [Flavitalea flava]
MKITTLIFSLFWICPATLTINNSPFIQESLTIQIPWVPVPQIINNKQYLVYEIRLTNITQLAIQLKSITITDASSGKKIRQFEGNSIEERLSIIGNKPGEANAKFIKSGQHALFYLEYEIDNDQQPLPLKHQFTYSFKDPQEQTDKSSTIDGPAITILKKAPIHLSAPLRGGPWIAIYNPSWSRGHRRVVYSTDDHPRIPGRFAIDWVKLNEQGKFAAGDEDIVSNAFGYNEDVLAVASAIVASMRDSIKESTTVSGNGPHTPEEASGNYVALDLGDHHYVFYEHLRLGSIRVKKGDHVVVGQVIGKLGFTGDSSGPHLHLHMADNNSPLGAEGLPFVLDHFTVLGQYEDLSKLGKERWVLPASDEPEKRDHEFPAQCTVVKF